LMEARAIHGWRKLTSSKFHTEDPQILGTTKQNLIVQMTWHLQVMQPCFQAFVGRPQQLLWLFDTDVLCGNQDIKWFYPAAICNQNYITPISLCMYLLVINVHVSASTLLSF
jgi:hypothetical protein